MYLILAVANAVLLAHAIRVSARERPFALLFWVCSAFFAGYPLVVDSIYCATGHVDVILSVYRNNADGIPPVLDSTILNRTCMFVFAFNVIFYALLERIGGQQPRWRSAELSANAEARARFVAIVVAIGGILSLAYIVEFEFGGLGASLNQSASYYGFGPDGYNSKSRYLKEIANAFIYAAPFAAYFGMRRRQPLLILAGVVPPLVLAYITSQRPWLSCVAGVFALYVLGPGREIATRRLNNARRLFGSPWRLIAIAAIAFATLFSAYFVRYGRTESFTGDKADAAVESLSSSLLMRDVSMFVLYWTMDSIPDRLAPIGGFSTLHIPATLLHLPIEFPPSEQVGYYLALNRNGWSDGTLHPTVYGFAFCDLGWGGLVWAGIMAMIIGGAEIVSAGRQERVFALAPMMSLLITVVVRGSPHYGITRAWYSALLIGILFLLSATGEREREGMAHIIS